MPWFLIALATVCGAGLAVWANVNHQQVSSDVLDVRNAPPDPSVDPDRQLLWGLEIVNGYVPSKTEFEERFHPDFRGQVSYTDFVADTETVQAQGPYVVHGIERPLPEVQAVVALLQASSGDTYALQASMVDDRIGGLIVSPIEVRRGPFTGPELAAHLVAAVALVAAGVTTGLRGRSRFGLLLCGAGGLWMMQLLELSDHDALFTVGLLAGPLALAMVVATVLAFPSGRLQRPVDWVLTVLTFAVAGGAAVGLLFIDTALWSLPAQALAIDHQREAFDAAVGLRAVATIVVYGVIILALGYRWWRTAALSRQPMAAMAIGGSFLAVTTVAVAAAQLRSIADDSFDLSQPIWLSFASLAVPLAVAVSSTLPQVRLGSVAGLVADLGSDDASLRDSLAANLGDQSLELLYWSEPKQSYVSATGAEANLPDSPTRAVTMLEAGDQPLGAVIHDPDLLTEPERIEAACGAVSLALRNERLQAVIAAQLHEVQASRARIIEAEEQARRQFERDLHDGAQQRLLALQLSATLERGRVAPEPGSDLDRYFDQLIGELSATLEELRDLGRGLHPGALDRGLAAAVRSVAERSPVPVSIVAPDDLHCSETSVTVAYYVINEALTNTHRHASANKVDIELACRSGVLNVLVTDDGVGGALLRVGAAPSTDGLQNMVDRVEAIGGSITIDSPKEVGTTITVELPCEP